MDNSQSLGTEGILRGIELWYEDAAQKSKAELEALYRARVSYNNQEHIVSSVGAKCSSSEAMTSFIVS